jgi:hypothetical protein
MGGIADLLALGYKLPNMPRMGVPGLDFVAANRNRLMDMLGVGDVQKTAETMSYGGRLGTGAGMTYRPLPETLGAAMAVAPMVAPAARMAGEGAMATGRFVAPKAGQLAEQYMVRTGGILPLDVYHGTPHTLPPTPRNPLGEFDASKIGTGEGAQAYGHGTYVAENPAVATGYRDKLQKVNYNGSEIDPSNPSHVALATVQQFGNKEKASAYLKQRANLMDYEINMQAAKLLDEGSALPTRNATGNLYKVDLPDEKIAKMLDFDKHLSEQPKAVQDILLRYQKEIGGSFGTGEQTLKAIAFERRMKGLDDSPAAVAQQLKDMGIPGIKYFDEGSRNLANTYIVRNSQGGENVFSSKAAAEAYVKKYPEDKLIEPKVTRNFVVFPGEEKSMTILERNGQPAQMSVADQIDNINEVLKKKRKK